MQHEMLIVGGGLAGASLAKVQAERGVRVLLVERERRFEDRVRGEGLLPWGVDEARRLGIHGDLVRSCAHEVTYWSRHRGNGVCSRRNLVETTPHRNGLLGFHHPVMQEAMLAAAEQAGAQVRRGVLALGVEQGTRPRVTVRGPGGTATLAADHVVIASGRHSRLRARAGFVSRRDPNRLRITGALLHGVDADEDSVHLLHSPARSGEALLLYPIGQGRFRAYLVRGPAARRSAPMRARASEARAQEQEIVACCVAAGAPMRWFERSAVIGPVATFEGAASWVEHPHAGAVTLIGDAAATTDPSWGYGLALALRDVRVLCEHLQAGGDREAAGHAYARAHDQYHGALHRLADWMTELFYGEGPGADARRMHALALQRMETDRGLDLVGLGPDVPSDERARQRFFGEDRVLAPGPGQAAVTTARSSRS